MTDPNPFLTRLRGELEAATPRPWHVYRQVNSRDRVTGHGVGYAPAYPLDCSSLTCGHLSEDDATLISHAPTYLSALLDVASAAVEAVSECRLAPDTARGRQWCVAHQEWTPCPVADLAAALERLEEL